MKFLKNLLGIDEVLEKVNLIGEKLDDSQYDSNELSKNTKLTFLNPINNSIFLSVEKLESCDETFSKINIGKGSRFNSMLQALPMSQVIAQNKMLEGAYKVIMPKDSVGTLMKYKNGLLGTPLVNSSSGKIAGHAGLSKITNLPMSPVIIFTAMSFITGQYFMSQINSSLKNISKDINDIIKFLFDDKESRNYAIYQLCLDISTSMDIIIENQDIRIAYLTNIQSSLIDLNQNIKFYEKTIDRKRKELSSIINDNKRTNDRINDSKIKFKELNKLILQRYFCLQLYAQCKILEMQLAQIYDTDYIEKIINQLNNIKNESTLYNIRIVEDTEKVFKKINDKNWVWSEEDIFIKRDEIIGYIQENNEKFIVNYNSTIEGMNNCINFIKKDNTFIVEGDNLYIVYE